MSPTKEFSLDTASLVGIVIGAILAVLSLFIIAFFIVYFFFPEKIITWLQRFQLRSSGMKRKVVTSASDYRFHFAERGSTSVGENNPSLLILHGFSESLDQWSLFVKNLPSTIHCVALDLPGHGQSSLTDVDELTLAGMVGRVHEFVTLIGLNRAKSGVHVLGHSMGGAIAGEYSATHSEEDAIRLLTLVCPAMRTPVSSPFWEAMQAGSFEEWLLPDSVDGLRLMMSRIMLVEEKKLDKTRQLLKGVYKLREPKNNEYRRIWQGLQPEFERADVLVQGWNRNTMPSQIIWGTEDCLIDKSGADVLGEILPNSQTDIMENAPHGINLVDNENLARLVAGFREKARSLGDEACVENAKLIN